MGAGMELHARCGRRLDRAVQRVGEVGGPAGHPKDDGSARRVFAVALAQGRLELADVDA